MSWLSPANAVFASLLAVQVGVMGYMQLSEQAADTTIYESASVEKPAVNNTAQALFLIEFQDDATHGEVRDFLNKWQARIVSGPDNQNMFSVELNTDAATDAVAFAEFIMQQAAKDKAPVVFIGSQYKNEQ